MYKIIISFDIFATPRQHIITNKYNNLISLHFLTDFNSCAQTHIISQPFPYCLF